MKEEYIMICPKCGSANVRSDLTKEMIAWGGVTRMICDDCSHSGSFFPEVEKSKVKKAKQEVQYGKIKENASKGITHKVFASAWVLYEIIGICLTSLVLIGWGLAEKNKVTVWIGVFLLLIFPILIAYARKKSKN